MIDDKIIEGLREYLKKHYVPSHILSIGAAEDVEIDEAEGSPKEIYSCFCEVSDEAVEYIKKHRKKEDFAHTLEKKRKEKGLKPAELYKKANVDRRQYSRYMGPEGRHPSMNTVISFALALRLERTEFDEFLQTAGYSLSNASSRDVCLMYCLEKSIYDIDEVNALLFAIGIEPLSRDGGA